MTAQQHVTFNFLKNKTQRGKMLCCRDPNPKVSITKALQVLPFNTLQQEILRTRYDAVLYEYKIRSHRYAIWFHSLRSVITIGSLIVPALLSVQFGSSTSEYASAAMYWITWTLSLFVTMSNGILTLYKIDKKYFMLHTIYEQLLSEGWQFVGLTGRYGGHYTPSLRPTHDNQFRFFCHAIEKIKMRQVEEEYFKVTESGHSHTQQQDPTQQKDSKSLVPPTPAAYDLLTQFLAQKKDGATRPPPPTIPEAANEEIFSVAETETETDEKNAKQESSATAPNIDSELYTSSALYQTNGPKQSANATLSV